MRKTLITIILLVKILANISGQNNTIVLSINPSKDIDGLLIMTVQNLSDMSLTVGEFDVVFDNRIFILNEKGINRDFHSECIQRQIEKITINSGDAFSWEFNLTQFFYPQAYPLPQSFKSGRYHIIWHFKNKVSTPYFYDFVRKE